MIEKYITIKWNNTVKKYYELKGYKFTKYGDNFKIKVEDLPSKSNIKVDVQCDDCKKHFKVIWSNYKKCVKPNNKYYCHKCAMKMIDYSQINKIKLKNSKSLEQWCVDNDCKQLLELWDCELNKCSPKEILNGSKIKYYFKCPLHKHKSELHHIHDLEERYKRKGINNTCHQCNSFAQWGIDNICSDFLEKYWDYDKNKDIDPWRISYGWNHKVWIKCQEHDYHGSYEINCSNFTIAKCRCPYCVCRKIHRLDSLGYLFPQVLEIWSDKNTKSPYEYAPHSGKQVWWRCSEGKHEDFLRRIADSLNYDFRCPQCNFSKGEKRIEDWLINKNIKYKTQKTFNNLVGIHNGLLSYDFYLLDYNLLIEYQGEFHDGNTRKQTKKDKERQQEHDRRKNQYTVDNNIKLLEIWYWNFDKIEEILYKKLKGEINND